MAITWTVNQQTWAGGFFATTDGSNTLLLIAGTFDWRNDTGSLRAEGAICRTR